MKRPDIPIGTRFGWLVTTGEPRYQLGGHSLVRCKCVCETERDFRIASLGAVSGRGGQSSCGCLRQNSRRYYAAASPSFFREELESIAVDPTHCAWCGLPYPPEPPKRQTLVSVDHAHDIGCTHKSQASACRRCVRGLVHQHCNLRIATIDEGVCGGYLWVLDDAKRSYLTTFPLRRTMTVVDGSVQWACPVPVKHRRA
jgi:hypothetical protein